MKMRWFHTLFDWLECYGAKRRRRRAERQRVRARGGKLSAQRSKATL